MCPAEKREEERTLKWIYRLHRITSFIAAPFLVILCLTGFILLFESEISDSLGAPASYGAPVEEEELYRRLSEGIAKAKEIAPGQELRSVRFITSQGQLRFYLQDAGDAAERRIVDLSLENGVLKDTSPDTSRHIWVRDALSLMARLHVRLNDGEAGRILMGVMCGVAMISIGTGFVLYPKFMKGLSFGTRRAFSWRLWWSDWHKILGILAGGWLFLLSFSGLGLFLHAKGQNRYIDTAWKAAEAHFVPPSGEALPVEEALTIIRRRFPEKRIAAIGFPEENHPFYAFDISERPKEIRLYTPRHMVFLAADGADELIPPQPPAWLALAPLALNLHFRNHDTLWLKGMWGFFLIFSLLLTVSGIAIYLARFSKAAAARRTIIPVINLGRCGVWLLGLLPVLGLFLPFHGLNMAALITFALAALGTIALVDKEWFRRKKKPPARESGELDAPHDGS